jgi:hypothetical protein
MSVQEVAFYFDQHGVFTMFMKKGYHTATAAVVLPQAELTERIQDFFGFGRLSIQVKDGKEWFWLSFNEGQSVRICGAIAGCTEEMFWQMEKVRYILQLHLLKGQKKRAFEPLYPREVEKRDALMKKMRESEGPPYDIRYGFMLYEDWIKD